VLTLPTIRDRRWLLTLYGDMVGGLALIADVPRHVYSLSRYLEWDQAGDPQSTMDKAPSAGAAAARRTLIHAAL